MALRQFMQAAAELVQMPAFHYELARTLVAWAMLYVVGVWMVICQQWSDTRWVLHLQHESHSTSMPLAPWPATALLQDQMLDFLPVLERAWISDKLVGTSIIICIIGCLVLTHGWRMRVMLLRRLGWMVTLLYLLRSITISVTTVPPSTPLCQIAPAQTAWQLIRATPDILAGSVGQCTDKIFSGHTTILFISFLFWRRYATHWAFIAYSAVHTTVGITTVLMARYHYTVDVVIALLLTFFVHHTYYAALAQAVQSHTGLCFDTVDCQGDSVYSMAIVAPKPEWDRDSALGVDTSVRVSSPDQFVRKREPLSNPDSDAGDHTPQLNHHEIEVVESLDLHPMHRVYSAQEITQASAQIQLNSTTSPIGTEWIGIVIMQVRAPTDNSIVQAGQVTDYATAHYIDCQNKYTSRGMYLQGKIDKDDVHNSDFSLKVVAHYNMVANNTIYQGLWSDGQIWTYLGSLVLQHPKTSGIKEEVARALEGTASMDTTQGANKLGKAAVHESEVPVAVKDPLSSAKAPKTLATCNIDHDSSGHIHPVCHFVRQLPMVSSFEQPFSGIRRTTDGNSKYERTGVFKGLTLRSRLASVYDIATARCVSHNRKASDIAACQRDPTIPEFIVSIDGIMPEEAKERANLMEGGNAINTDAELVAKSQKMHHEASKLPEVNDI
ncbi:hypothetical protein LPJ62_000622 [Coemansia sp. RSA 2167]|nr:hypothetical protein LPJ62_000622 [Coemansia sp. RSA 2167]